MIVKLLTEHNLEFLSLKEGCTGSSESTLVKMPHYWKSHVTAHISSSSTSNTKEDQVVNIREVFDQCSSGDVLLFTNRSALTNSGPTGAGAVIYLDVYSTSTILLQKGVSP